MQETLGPGTSRGLALRVLEQGAEAFSFHEFPVIEIEIQSRLQVHCYGKATMGAILWAEVPLYWLQAWGRE